MGIEFGAHALESAVDIQKRHGVSFDMICGIDSLIFLQGPFQSDVFNFYVPFYTGSKTTTKFTPLAVYGASRLLQGKSVWIDTCLTFPHLLKLFSRSKKVPSMRVSKIFTNKDPTPTSVDNSMSLVNRLATRHLVEYRKTQNSKDHVRMQELQVFLVESEEHGRQYILRITIEGGARPFTIYIPKKFWRNQVTWRNISASVDEETMNKLSRRISAVGNETQYSSGPGAAWGASERQELEFACLLLVRICGLSPSDRFIDPGAGTGKTLAILALIYDVLVEKEGLNRPQLNGEDAVGEILAVHRERGFVPMRIPMLKQPTPPVGVKQGKEKPTKESILAELDERYFIDFSNINDIMVQHPEGVKFVSGYVNDYAPSTLARYLKKAEVSEIIVEM